MGSAVDLRIFANGTKVAHLAWAERVTFPVAPGEVIVEVQHPTPSLIASDSAVINAVAKQHYYYRVTFSVDGPRLVRTTEASAKGG